MSVDQFQTSSKVQKSNYEFRVYSPLQSTDFGLLDGTAEFRFGASGGFLVATTYVTRFPRVTVDSATLIVDGTALTPIVGDYTGDGVVDAQDYALWRETFGSSTDLRSDGNGDGIVDAGDFTVWRDNMTASNVGASPSSNAVPEFSTISLAILACWPCLACRRI